MPYVDLKSGVQPLLTFTAAAIMSKHKHYELQGLPSNLSSSKQMGPRNSEQMRLSRCFIALAAITAIVSLACLVSGLTLIVRYHNKACDSPRKAWQEKQRDCDNCSTTVPITTSTVAITGQGVPTLQHFTRPPPSADPCDFSAEARRSGTDYITSIRFLHTPLCHVIFQS